jgi:geranylgeranyl diphosphate synthase type II
MQIQKFQGWIESEIKKLSFGKEPDSLYEPARYLMQLGGKRLRPMLTLIAYSLYKSDVRKVVKYSAAVEAFHNFTLMHDDIMDKAPLRRGNPTVHKLWNINTAILSGDVMLVKVYEMFTQLPADVLIDVLQAFNVCAAEVCEGQQLDMEFETRSVVSEKEYIAMIRKKTAVLLGFSLELGAILGGASLKDRKALRDFGTFAGIGFQLKDDFLDAYANPEKFGKQVGGDILSNKKTFLLIKSLELASKKERAELNELLTAKKFNKQTKIDAVKHIYDRIGVPTLSEKAVQTYFRKAIKSLDRLQVAEAKKLSIKKFAETLIDRQS